MEEEDFLKRNFSKRASQSFHNNVSSRGGIFLEQPMERMIIPQILICWMFIIPKFI